MTQAQKTAKAKFKQAIAYRQKTGVSLKEAFAHIYGKKKVGAVKKKSVPKKKIGNMKVSKYKVGQKVYSYQNKDYAAPINKLVYSPWSNSGKYDKRDTYKYVLSLKDGNSNFIDEKSISKKSIGAVKKKLAPKKKAAKKVAKKKLTRIDYDKRYQAKKPGKRVSKTGKTYYENRENRIDRGKLLGIKIGNIPTYKDKDAAREVQLFADNDYMLYQQRKRPILINLGKKYKKGTYDVNKAAKLWRYYVDAALQKYHKENGSKGDNWYDMLSVPDRNLLSLDYAIETKNEFDLGNFTN